MVSHKQVCSPWGLTLKQWPPLCAGSSAWGWWKLCVKGPQCPQVSLYLSRLKSHSKRSIRTVRLTWTVGRVWFLTIIATHSHWFLVWHWLSNAASVTRVASRVNLLHSHPLSWLACCLLLKVGARLLYAVHAQPCTPQNKHLLIVFDIKNSRAARCLPTRCSAASFLGGCSSALLHPLLHRFTIYRQVKATH